MAQKVGYFENKVTFHEGPFVYTNATGFRVEVEMKGHKCPVLPELNIYYLLENNLMTAGKADEEDIIKSVDFLNEKVRKGEIILKEGRYWDTVEEVGIQLITCKEECPTSNCRNKAPHRFSHRHHCYQTILGRFQ